MDGDAMANNIVEKVNEPTYEDFKTIHQDLSDRLRRASNESANMPGVMNYKFLRKSQNSSPKQDECLNNDSLARKSTELQIFQSQGEKSIHKSTKRLSNIAFTPYICQNQGDQEGLTNRLTRTLSPLKHHETDGLSLHASMQVRGDAHYESCDLDSPAKQEEFLFQEYARISPRKDKDTLGQPDACYETPRCSLEQGIHPYIKDSKPKTPFQAGGPEIRNNALYAIPSSRKKKDIDLNLMLNPVLDEEDLDNLRGEQILSSSFTFSNSSD